VPSEPPVPDLSPAKIGDIQLPREIIISSINTNFSALAGLSAARDGLFTEAVASPYVNVLVVREADQDNEKLQKLKDSFQAKEVESKS